MRGVDFCARDLYSAGKKGKRGGIGCPPVGTRNGRTAGTKWLERGCATGWSPMAYKPKHNRKGFTRKPCGRRPEPLAGKEHQGLVGVALPFGSPCQSGPFLPAWFRGEGRKTAAVFQRDRVERPATRAAPLRLELAVRFQRQDRATGWGRKVGV